ncbi:MAG: hypothetical protein IKR25_04215 [Muribaculaceae bacterium]|nr:hypothetical protein [Muribaculaceae bacterium]
MKTNSPHYPHATAFGLVLLTASLIKVALSGCQHPQPTFVHHPMRAIYHWKTTFAPTPGELAFINRHHVGRLYIHYFDVVLRDNVVQPEATVQFIDTPPDSLEVVPTIFITPEAMRAMQEENESSYPCDGHVLNSYAQRIVKRVNAMNKHNCINNVGEVQIDCDWTSQLRSSYFQLLAATRQLLHEQGMGLSVTVRLHQLSGAEPPADMGVLMLYNTGNIMNPHTRNSILDLNDVRPYFKATTHYRLPLDFAYPDFGWQVCYRDGKFLRLASPGDTTTQERGTMVRREQADFATIKSVKHLAEQSLSQAGQSACIIYHLDEQFLNLFTHDQIETIYSTTD